MERPAKRGRVPDQPDGEPELAITLPPSGDKWLEWKICQKKVCAAPVAKRPLVTICSRINADRVLIAQCKEQQREQQLEAARYITGEEVAAFLCKLLNGDSDKPTWFGKGRWVNAPFSKDSCDYNQFTILFDILQETSIDVSAVVSKLYFLNEGKHMPNHRFCKLYVHPGKLAIECEAVALVNHPQDT